MFGSRAIGEAIVEFVQRHDALSVGMADRITGFPHEEGIDYPDGAVCPSVHSGQIGTG